MISSMTGFGDAHLENMEQAYSLELRSVNNRYFKANIHLPDEFAFLESEAERYLRERISRGSITVRVHVRALTAKLAPELNVPAIRHYVEQLANAVGNGRNVTVDLATLALLPGVAQPHELSSNEREQSWGLIEKLLAAALARLLEMRRAEGALLADDLRQHCAQIRAQLTVIQQRAPAVTLEYRDRLLARVNQLLAGSGVVLAANDLLKEVAIYADRSDISEEVSRLGGHLEQFEKYMAAPEAAGRKLEFIAQEMMREANTMGSKTGDVEISRAIIEIKSSVDRIKEQVLNVE